MRLILLSTALWLPGTCLAADYADCREALVTAEQASRSAQEVLLVARAREQAPDFDEALERLATGTKMAERACGGASETANEGALSDFLSDDGGANTIRRRERRTPAERAHGLR